MITQGITVRLKKSGKIMTVKRVAGEFLVLWLPKEEIEIILVDVCIVRLDNVEEIIQEVTQLSLF